MTTARRVRFSYPPETRPVWTPHRPEFSCAANSVSLLMPAIEPYFVRSARRALPALNESLRAEAEIYIEQEAQHFGQHVVFNRLLLDRYSSLARLEVLSKKIYRDLEASRSLEFSLAFAASSETMAYSAARWAAARRRELFSDPATDETAATLFLWHLAEEVEHKSVAHDIYRAAVRPSARSMASPKFVAAMLLSLALVVFFVFAGTSIMLWAERRFFHPLAWIRLIRWVILFSFELLTNLTLSLLPGFHPADFADPTFYDVWLDEFDAASGTIPLWNTVDQAPGSQYTGNQGSVDHDAGSQYTDH